MRRYPSRYCPNRPTLHIQSTQNDSSAQIGHQYSAESMLSIEPIIVLILAEMTAKQTKHQTAGRQYKRTRQRKHQTANRIKTHAAE